MFVSSLREPPYTAPLAHGAQWPLGGYGGGSLRIHTSLAEPRSATSKLPVLAGREAH